jgi:hypothetical protein
MFVPFERCTVAMTLMIAEIEEVAVGVSVRFLVRLIEGVAVRQYVLGVVVGVCVVGAVVGVDMVALAVGRFVVVLVGC